jgi:hypothetical protein
MKLSLVSRRNWRLLWDSVPCEGALTIDELMVSYKEKFCCIYQYLPSKPIKWGIKIWILCNVVPKYINFIDLGFTTVRAKSITKQKLQRRMRLNRMPML